MLTFGSLFSGIGGLDLGLERSGMKCLWQSEIDPYACKVLKKHWDHLPNLGDIKQIKEAPHVDLICGGFPCQDISNAGKRAGITGSHSGLWGEMVRTVRLVRPLNVLVENVAALLIRGMGRVLGDLAESGYDSEWDCIPAAAVGAPHLRHRIFIVGHTISDGRKSGAGSQQAPAEGCRTGLGNGCIKTNVADSKCLRKLQPQGSKQDKWRRISDSSTDVPNTKQVGWSTRRGERGSQEGTRIRWNQPSQSGWWSTEPDVVRVAHGVPKRVDRLRCLGNAVVPQVAEYIGNCILDSAVQGGRA